MNLAELQREAYAKACPVCACNGSTAPLQEPKHWPLWWFEELCATHDQVARASGIWPPKGWAKFGSKRKPEEE